MGKVPHGGDMERREFLRMGVAGASGMLLAGAAFRSALADPLAGEPGCDPLPYMEEYLQRVDRGLAQIDSWAPSAAFPAYAGDRQAVDDLARKSLRTLYVTATFSDLPRQAQLHPRMQERMWEALPEFDEAVTQMVDFLERQTPEDLTSFQQV